MRTIGPNSPRKEWVFRMKIGKGMSTKLFAKLLCLLLLLPVFLLIMLRDSRQLLLEGCGEESVAAAGRSIRKIEQSLTYGKGLDNYSGIEGLISEVDLLLPWADNVYLCDRQGVVTASRVRMLEGTRLKDSALLQGELGRFSIVRRGSDYHIYQSIGAGEKQAGYLVVTLSQETVNAMAGSSASTTLLLGLGAATLAATLWLPRRIRCSPILVWIPVAVFSISTSLGYYYCSGQTGLKITQEHSRVLGQAIVNDMEELAKKGFTPEDVAGMDEYLAGRLEAFDWYCWASLTMEGFPPVVREQMGDGALAVSYSAGGITLDAKLSGTPFGERQVAAMLLLNLCAAAMSTITVLGGVVAERARGSKPRKEVITGEVGDAAGLEAADSTGLRDTFGE